MAEFEFGELLVGRDLRVRTGHFGRALAHSGNTIRMGFGIVQRTIRRLAFRRVYALGTGYSVTIARGSERLHLPFA